MTRLGIDYAHWQKHINYPLLPPEIEVLAAKATEGLKSKDPLFQENRTGMAVRSYRLYYHWLTLDDPRRQAIWFFDNVGELSVGEGWMLDFEQPKTTAAMAAVWVDTIRRMTNREYGYCYTGCTNTGQGFKGHESWNDANLWDPKLGRFLAWYGSLMAATRGAAPHTFHAWQWTDRYQTAGIGPLVDCDRFYDTEFLDKACGYNNTVPIIEARIEQATPIQLPLTLEYEGSHMYAIVANSDAQPNTPESQVRWAWNGLVKVLLSWEKYLDFAHAGLLIVGHDDLKVPLMMNGSTLDSYPTV